MTGSNPKGTTHDIVSRHRAESADALALHRPKLILPIGSGGAGKSFWSRWFIERAAKRGAPSTSTTPIRCRPPWRRSTRHADRFDHAPRFGLDHQNWLEKKITASAESRRSLILDPGPMLFGLIEWFAHTPVALAAEELGLDFVAVYLIVPDPDSLPRLPYFLDLIKAPRTVIVLNEWRMGADDGASAFADIIVDPRIAAARADGARIITMPHLPAARPPRRPSLPQPETSQSGALRTGSTAWRTISLRSPPGSTDMRQARLSYKEAGFFSLRPPAGPPIQPLSRFQPNPKPV